MVRNRHNPYIRTRPKGGNRLEVYHTDPDCHLVPEERRRSLEPDHPRLDQLRECQRCAGKPIEQERYGHSEAYKALQRAAESES